MTEEEEDEEAKFPDEKWKWQEQNRKRKQELIDIKNDVINRQLGREPDIFKPTLPANQLHYVHGDESQVVVPIDPNEKSGPIGIGPEGFISLGEELSYTIYFENQPTATAPAQEVFIVDYLDEDLDWTTFYLNEYTFGDQIVSVGDEMDNYNERVMATVVFATTETLYVDMEASLDYGTGRVAWTFKSIDPETGELPSDPLVGLLPPEDGSGRGQGHVSFSIRPKSTCAPGTVITNQASIVFDVNPPMDTNTVSNTIADLPVETPAWPGPDDGAMDVSVNTVLNWSDTPHATSYDIYFWPEGQAKHGTPTASGLISSYFVPAWLPLDPTMVYYWQVVARNISSQQEGPQWSFTTGEGMDVGDWKPY